MSGSLELILGPMFSGKTSALQSILRRHDALGLKCIAFKPQIDNRYHNPLENSDAYDTYYIYNHDKVKSTALSVTYLTQIARSSYYDEAQLILVEEGQFFSDLYEFVLKAVEVDGKNVVVAGLDGDRFRKPFGQLLQLIPLADRITKLTALCKMCATTGQAVSALFSYGAPNTSSVVHVAGPECYMPLCRQHYLAKVPSSTEVKTPPTEVSRLPADTLPVLPRLQNLRSKGSSISYPAVADQDELRSTSLEPSEPLPTENP